MYNPGFRSTGKWVSSRPLCDTGFSQAAANVLYAASSPTDGLYAAASPANGLYAPAASYWTNSYA
jgi:hypothetical protein